MTDNFRGFLDRLRDAGEMIDLTQAIDIRHIATLVDQSPKAVFFHDVIGYEHVQYERLAALCNCICHAYDMQQSRIVGHADIAPGRKTDPGPAFDWSRFRRLL